jgi:hypothetical protein
MLWVADRQDLVRYAKRARRRQRLVRGVAGLQKSLLYGLSLAFLGVVADRVFSLRLPWPAVGLGLLGAAALGGLLFAFIPNLELLEAAGRVDARAGWKERLLSALSLPSVAHPMEQALVEDVRERLKQQSVSRLFPFQAARELKLVPLAGAALGLAFFIPALDVLGLEARQKEKAKEKEELKSVVQKLEERRKKLEKEDRPLDRVKEAIKKIDALAAQLHQDPPPERKEALAKIATLAEELEKMKHELSQSAALAEKLQKAASKDSGEPGQLTPLLKVGKFMEAAQELAKLRNKLEENKLSPADKARLEKELQKLLEKMGQDKDLNELEKKLARAMKGLNEDHEKDLSDFQKSLQELDSDLTEKEMLAQALDDLEKLADALAQDERECPTCGSRMKGGKCKGKDGKG